MAIICVAADSHLRSSQTMSLSATTPFSVTCWLLADFSGVTRSFVGIYGPATDVALGAPVTAMQIGCDVTNQLNCWTWGGGVLVNTPNGMSAFNGQWIHVAYTFDGTTHRVYINGNPPGTGFSNSALNSANPQIAGFLNQVYINGYPGSLTNEVYTHSVDSYALYRRALSDNEVLSIYNSQGARHGITNGLIARYEFDEGILGASATGVVDMSGNGNILTFTGAGAAITYTYSGSVANSNTRPVQ